MIPRERFDPPKRSRNDVLGAIFGSENCLFGLSGVQKCLILMIWALLVRFLLFWEPFLGHFGVPGDRFGIPKLPQTTPRGPPKHPRSVPQGCLGDSPGACIFTCFSCCNVEKHYFPCIFTAGLNWVDGIGPRGMHFYMVFLYHR